VVLRGALAVLSFGAVAQAVNMGLAFLLVSHDLHALSQVQCSTLAG
jgi:hypothetical protein